MSTELPTPTPQEDVALLRVAMELRWTELSPSLRHIQWQAVAQCVATASGASVKTPDQTRHRFEALLELATTTERTQWPADEELRDMLQTALNKQQKISETVVALETQATTSAVRPTTREKPAAEQEVSLEDPPASAGDSIADRSGGQESGAAETIVAVGSSEVVDREATTATDSGVVPTGVGEAVATPCVGKRKRETDEVRFFIVQEDAVIARAVGELKPGSAKAKWIKVAERVSSELGSEFQSTECQARYLTLMNMNRASAEARFQATPELLSLVNTARTAFVADEVMDEEEIVDSDEAQDAMPTSLASTGVLKAVPLDGGATAAVVTPPQSNTADTQPAQPSVPVGMIDDEAHLVTPEEAACAPVVAVAGIAASDDTTRPKTDREEIEELKKTVASLSEALAKCRRRHKAYTATIDQHSAKIKKLEEDRGRILNTIQLHPTPTLLKEISARTEQNTRLVVETKKLLHTELDSARTTVANAHRLLGHYNQQIDRSETKFLQWVSKHAKELERLASDQSQLSHQVAALKTARDAADAGGARLHDHGQRVQNPVAATATGEVEALSAEFVKNAIANAQQDFEKRFRKDFAKFVHTEKNLRAQFTADFTRHRDQCERSVQSHAESLNASVTLVITRMREHQDVQKATITNLLHTQQGLENDVKEVQRVNDRLKESIGLGIHQLREKMEDLTAQADLKAQIAILQSTQETLATSVKSELARLQEQQTSLAATLAAEISPVRELQTSLAGKLQTETVQARETQESLTLQINQMRERLESNVESLTSEIKQVRQMQASMSTSINADIQRLREALAKSTSAGVDRIRELEESNANAIHDLVVKRDEAAQADRARQAIFFEMVEAETLKREELAALVQRQQEKHQADEESRDETLLWFQEEMQQELEQLQDRLSEELISYNEVLDVIRMEQISSSETLENKITSMNKQQEGTKRHLLDQYLKSTLQLHELRNAVERERQERSQEFTSLLQNIHQLINAD